MCGVGHVVRWAVTAYGSALVVVGCLSSNVLSLFLILSPEHLTGFYLKLLSVIMYVGPTQFKGTEPLLSPRDSLASQNLIIHSMLMRHKQTHRILPELFQQTILLLEWTALGVSLFPRLQWKGVEANGGGGVDPGTLWA